MFSHSIETIERENRDASQVNRFQKSSTWKMKPMNFKCRGLQQGSQIFNFLFELSHRIQRIQLCTCFKKLDSPQNSRIRFHIFILHLETLQVYSSFFMVIGYSEVFLVKSHNADIKQFVIFLFYTNFSLFSTVFGVAIDIDNFMPSHDLSCGPMSLSCSCRTFCEIPISTLSAHLLQGPASRV